MTLEQGDIVLVDIADPNGKKCLTPHPAMVLTRSDEICSKDEIWVVAITGRFGVLEDGWFEVPHRANPPHKQTGLWKRSVLKCQWRRRIRKVEIIQKYGRVSMPLLMQVVAWIKNDIDKKKA